MKRLHHGRHRAGTFCVSKSSEMAFSKSSLPLLLGPFMNSFIMICESMSGCGLLRQMLSVSQNIEGKFFMLG
jgi:hypothetical protein